jgi:hypothetical protein
VAASPTTPLLDAFDRADGALGAPWTLLRPTGSAPVISGNRVMRGAANGLAVRTDVAYGESEAWIEVPVIPANTEGASVVVRARDVGLSTVDYYQATYTRGSGWRLFVVVNNGYTALISFVAAPVLAGGDAFMLRATNQSGNTNVLLELSHKPAGGLWAPVTSFLHSTGTRITTPGFVGMEVVGTTVRLDNFGGGTYVATCQDDAVTGIAITGNATTGAWWACTPEAGLKLGGELPDVTILADNAPPPAGLRLGAVAPALRIDTGVADVPLAGLKLGAYEPAFRLSTLLQVDPAGLLLGATIPAQAGAAWLVPSLCTDIPLALSPETELVLVGASSTDLALDPLECV